MKQRVEARRTIRATLDRYDMAVLAQTMKETGETQSEVITAALFLRRAILRSEHADAVLEMLQREARVRLGPHRGLRLVYSASTKNRNGIN